jgi:hypothetical protein
MSITPEQKKRRFRELARHYRLRTARELLEEIEQPFLFNEFKTRVSQENPRRAGARQAAAK